MSSTQQSYQTLGGERPSGFSCLSYADGPGFTRVKLRGELDLATAPQLDGQLSVAARGSEVVILDLSELAFMDSSGLQVILSARARLAEADCRLVLVPGDRQVQQVFKLSGVDRLLEFVSAPDAQGAA